MVHSLHSLHSLLSAASTHLRFRIAFPSPGDCSHSPFPVTGERVWVQLGERKGESSGTKDPTARQTLAHTHTCMQSDTGCSMDNMLTHRNTRGGIHTPQTCDVVLHLLLEPSGRVLLLVKVVAVHFEQVVRRLVRFAKVLQ